MKDPGHLPDHDCGRALLSDQPQDRERIEPDGIVTVDRSREGIVVIVSDSSGFPPGGGLSDSSDRSSKSAGRRLVGHPFTHATLQRWRNRSRAMMSRWISLVPS